MARSSGDLLAIIGCAPQDDSLTNKWLRITGNGSKDYIVPIIPFLGPIGLRSRNCMTAPMNWRDYL